MGGVRERHPCCGNPHGDGCLAAYWRSGAVMGAVMIKLRVLDLFSGIGGFSLGLERTGGFETVAFCEIEPFQRQVLAKHWPEVPQYDDIRTLNAEVLARDGIAVDVICGGFPVICGGFPCQDISNAGHQEGLAGERSGLWFEYDRLIGELRPRIAIMENVGALLHRGLQEVLGCLAARGYDAWWEIIRASDIGLPHPRERVWIVAYSDQVGWQARSRIESLLLGETLPWHEGQQMELRGARSGGVRWIPNGCVCIVDNGLSANVDGIGAAGNAVVPQIPELIGNAILASMREAA